MNRSERRFPLLTLGLVLAIVAVYGLELAGDGMGLCRSLGFVPADPSVGTALSSLFLHDPSGLTHVGANGLVLAVVGTLVEREVGAWRFAALFVLGGLAGAGLHVVVDPASTTPLVGCSGSLFALLAAAAVLYGPATLVFVVLLATANVVQAFGGPGDAAVSFACHLGGLACGVALVALARLCGSMELRRPRARRAAALGSV